LKSKLKILNLLDPIPMNLIFRNSTSPTRA
jgi:hypothetical protein